MLTKSLLRKSVSSKHPQYRRLTSLFEEMKALMCIVNTDIEHAEQEEATQFYAPLIADVNELICIAGVCLEGLNSHKGRLLLNENIEEVSSTTEMIEESFAQIKQQCQNFKTKGQEVSHV